MQKRETFTKKFLKLDLFILVNTTGNYLVVYVLPLSTEQIIPTAYEALLSWDSVAGSLEWPDWLEAVNDLSHTLIVFNSAVNFLLYTVL